MCEFSQTTHHQNDVCSDDSDVSRQFDILVYLPWKLPCSTNKLRCNDDVVMLVIKNQLLVKPGGYYNISTVIIAMFE